MEDDLVKEATYYLKEVDHIIDLYDLQLLWISEKWQTLGEYTLGDIKNTNVLTYLDDSYTDHDKRKIVIDRITKKKWV